MFRLLIRKHVIVGLVTGDLLYHKNQIKLLMNLRIVADKYFNITLAIIMHTLNLPCSIILKCF